MKFGPVPLDEAAGAILAHSVKVATGRLRKGLILAPEHLSALRRAGHVVVTVAILDRRDIGEDAAAAMLAQNIIPEPRTDMELTEAVAGRVNLIASQPGVLRVNAAAILAANAIDPNITIATLPDYARVSVGTMLATVKIIPYAVNSDNLTRAKLAVDQTGLKVFAKVITAADIILTKTEVLPAKLIKKGEDAVRARLTSLGVEVASVRTVDHDITALAGAVKKAKSSLILILGASATSDIADVCPAAVLSAGGTLVRFGMPVDPGNLLFLARIGTAHVIGLPGCARSPALNGADWVLERIVCGIDVEDRDIAAMGVGGLLKEIPARPHPRILRKRAMKAPRIDVILLAAGASRRMRGKDKLLEEIEGNSLLRRSAEAACASDAGKVHVVLAPGNKQRLAVLSGMDLDIVTALDAHEGMAASLSVGVQSASGADAVIVMLADMPEISQHHLNALIAAFDPAAGHEICRPVSAHGRPGHPVLFGRRFFESLMDLKGDQGARNVVKDAPEFVRDVPSEGDAVLLDLDTPEQWEAYRNRP